MGRKSSAVVFIAAAAGVAYTLSQFARKKRDPHLAQAIVYMEEEGYQAAIDHFVQVANKTPDVLRMLSTCHERVGNLVDALAYLNLCVRADSLQARSTMFERLYGTVRRLVPGHSEDEARPEIDINQLIEKRFHLHKKCGLLMEAFKDVFLLNLLEPDAKYNSTTSECLKICSMSKARAYHISGWASDINFSDFFDTLFFLKDVHDPAMVFIASSEFKKCFEYVRDSDTELHRFLTGCFLFVNGDVHVAIEAFGKETFIYSKMMFLFVKITARPAFVSSAGDDQEERQLKSEQRKNTDRKDDASAQPANSPSNPKTHGPETRKRYSDLFGTRDTDIKDAEKAMVLDLSGTEDITIQFYMAKIFGALKNTRLQLESINKCLSGRKTPPAMGYKVIMLIKMEKKEEAINLMNRALDIFPDDINLNCIAIEYFLHCNAVQRSLDLFLHIERIYPEDPRILIFKYLLGKTSGSSDVGVLRKAIGADPLYFKTYIHLGNHLMGDAESKDIYTSALKCARSFDELFTAFQLLIVVETQEALISEYPRLFN